MPFLILSTQQVAAAFMPGCRNRYSQRGLVTCPVAIIKWQRWELDLGLILGFLLSSKSLLHLLHHDSKLKKKKRVPNEDTIVATHKTIFPFLILTKASFYILTKMIFYHVSMKKSLKCRDLGD